MVDDGTGGEPLSGVLYIVSGSFHAAAAVEAAKSVRQTNPWLAIDIFTDCDVPDGLFDRVTRFGEGHQRSKVDFLPQSRFARTLYLDSDTRVIADLKPMFAVLERFDIALAHGHKRNGPRQNIFWRKPIPEAFPQINGGVILYRASDTVRRLLEEWKTAYHSAGFKWDQITLRELVWESDVRFYVLPPEYNVRYKKYLDVWTPDEAQPKILHFEEFYKDTAALHPSIRRADRSWRQHVGWTLRNLSALLKKGPRR